MTENPYLPKLSRKEVKEFQRARAREDLKLQILKLLVNFKSAEEPKYKFTDGDRIHVLSSIIARNTE